MSIEVLSIFVNNKCVLLLERERKRERERERKRGREPLSWNVFFLLAVSCFAVRSRVAVVFALSTLLLPNAVEV